MPQKTRVGNDRSQSTTDVARRRNRNEKLYKAGARSSVTLAAQNADRRAAFSEIELALSTRCRRSCPKKRPFVGFGEGRKVDATDTGLRSISTGRPTGLPGARCLCPKTVVRTRC